MISEGPTRLWTAVEMKHAVALSNDYGRQHGKFPPFAGFCASGHRFVKFALRIGRPLPLYPHQSVQSRNHLSVASWVTSLIERLLL